MAAEASDVRPARDSQVVEAAGRPIASERPAPLTSAGPAVGPLIQSPSAPTTHEGEVDKLVLLRQNWARVKRCFRIGVACC